MFPPLEAAFELKVTPSGFPVLPEIDAPACMAMLRSASNLKDRAAPAELSIAAAPPESDVPLKVMSPLPLLPPDVWMTTFAPASKVALIVPSLIDELLPGAKV